MPNTESGAKITVFANCVQHTYSLEPESYSKEQAARILGVSIPTMIADGIRTARVDGFSSKRIMRSELLRALKEKGLIHVEDNKPVKLPKGAQSDIDKLRRGLECEQ